jgi:hypothetical protein
MEQKRKNKKQKLKNKTNKKTTIFANVGEILPPFWFT